MKHLFGCTIVTLLSAVSLLASQACAVPANTQDHDNADFFPPVWGGGFQLMNANNGYGEPLNVSALSTHLYATRLILPIHEGYHIREEHTRSPYEEGLPQLGTFRWFVSQQSSSLIS